MGSARQSRATPDALTPVAHRATDRDSTRGVTIQSAPGNTIGGEAEHAALQTGRLVQHTAINTIAPEFFLDSGVGNAHASARTDSMSTLCEN